MRRSKLRSAWGLALAVLFGGAVAKAEPPPPPPGFIHSTTYRDNLPASPVPVAARPAPAPAPAAALPLTLPPMPVAPGAVSAEPGKPDHAGKPPAEHGGAHNGHGDKKEKEHGDHEVHHEPEDHNAIIVAGEYLFWRARRREQDFAIVGANPNWAPIGVIRNVDGDFDSGFRIGAGYHWCGGYEVFFNYTHYHSAADDLIPASTGQQIFPTLTHPALVTEVAAAKGESSLNLNVFDLEFGKRFKQGEFTCRGFVGPRYVNLDQTLQGTYTGGDINTDRVRRTLNIDAWGVRAGGEVNYHFWEFLGVYARASGSMLSGNFRSSLSEIANGQPLVFVSERYDKVIPVIDLGLGLSFQKGGCRITLGYEYANYFGVVEGIDFGDDAQPAKPNRRWGDLGLEGFVVRVEYLF